MEIITKCPVDKLTAFIHGAINSYCDIVKPSSVYPKFSSVWTFEEWLEAKESIINFYKEVLRKDSNDRIEDQLKGLEDSSKQVIFDVLALRKNDLRNTLLNKALSNEQSILKNFDWEVKLSLANDKLATTYEPRVSLTLEASVNESGSRYINFEMDRTSLAKLISSLENACKVVKEIKMQ